MLSSIKKTRDECWDRASSQEDESGSLGSLHEEHRGLHKDNVRARRSSMLQTVATILTLMALAVGGAWSFWAWAGDAHSKTEVNEKAISDVEKRMDKLSASLEDSSKMTNELREEVSALRADMRNGQEQRTRIIELLDKMNERLREVE